jgi:hypothetical protein
MAAGMADEKFPAADFGGCRWTVQALSGAFTSLQMRVRDAALERRCEIQR